MGLVGYTGVVEGRRDSQEARGRAAEEVRNGGLDGVVGAEDVNVHDRLESVGADAVDRGGKVACCASAATVSINTDHDEWLTTHIT